MLIPDFDFTKAKWDRYRAFHVAHARRYSWNDGSGLIVQFDTGEVIFTAPTVHCSLRRHYPEFNISIRSPRDEQFPKVTRPDGTPVARSHLLGRCQHFVIDHETGRVTALGASTRQRDDVPERLRYYSAGTSAYCAGKGRPVQGVPVELIVRHQPTPEQRAHLTKLRAQCAAWMALSEDVDTESRRYRKPDNAAVWVHYGMTHPVPWTSFAEATMQDMHIFDRIRLAEKGWLSPTKREQVAYLLAA